MVGWRRGIGVALLVVGCGALARAGASGCSADALPSTVTWDGEAYVAAWAAPKEGKVSVYVIRFKESDFGGGASLGSALDSKARLVMRADRLASAPEVVAGRDGLLVLAQTLKGELFAAALDRDGMLRKRARSIESNVGVTCAAPIRRGDGYAAAWMFGEEGNKRLRLALLDADAEVTESHDFPSAASECAIGGEGDRIGLISREPHASSFSIETFEATAESALGRRAERRMKMTTKSTKPLRLLALDEGWAMLFGDGSTTAMIVIVDDELREKSTFNVTGIDPASLDLGRNRHGVFVSWIANRELRMVKLSESGDVERDYRHGVARDALGTRTVGFEDRCATSWTSNHGGYITVLRAKSCREKTTESDRSVSQP